MPGRVCFPQLWPVIFITSFLSNRHRHPQAILPTISHRMESRSRPQRSSSWPVRKIRCELGRAREPALSLGSRISRWWTRPAVAWEKEWREVVGDLGRVAHRLRVVRSRDIGSRSRAPARCRLPRRASASGRSVSPDLPPGKRGAPHSINRVTRDPGQHSSSADGCLQLQCRAQRETPAHGRSDMRMNGIPAPAPASPPSFQFKASRQPMLWAALAYASGIVAGVYCWRPTLWWILAGASFATAAIYFSRRRSCLGWSLALGSFFLAGAFHIQLRAASPRLDTTIQTYADRRELQITAHVTHDGRVQEGGFNEIKQTVDLETEQVQIYPRPNRTDLLRHPAEHLYSPERRSPRGKLREQFTAFRLADARPALRGPHPLHHQAQAPA